MSTGQIARTRGKQVKTVSALLGRVVQDGDIKMVRYGKYIPTESTESTESSNSSSIKKDEKNIPTLFDIHEETSESKLSVLSVLSVPVPKSAPAPAAQESDASLPVAPPRLSANRLASAVAGATGDAPSADFPRFVQMVARETHSRFLNTDLANPTPNKMYQAIGYRPVGNALELRFA